jgi:xylan 1,4-beta-xylosidase
MPTRTWTFVGKQTWYLIINTSCTYSLDGKKWTILADKSNNKTDVPHDYIELEKPVQARIIKLENIHMPTGKFAISGLRVFGNGNRCKTCCR